MKMQHFLPLSLALTLAVSPLHAAQLNTSSTLRDTESTSSIPVPTMQFDPAIQDLPLMKGLVPVPDEATLFEDPHAGRVAESTVHGAVDIDEVYNFYWRSLPHMGWKRVDGHTYVRGQELLDISAHADGKVTTVRFSVKPIGD